MKKARQKKPIFLYTIVQSKTLKNFRHFKESTKKLMKLWQVMDLLSNVLILTTQSLLLDQEKRKALNSCIQIAIFKYLNFYLSSKA